jgi:hypothetical protein
VGWGIAVKRRQAGGDCQRKEEKEGWISVDVGGEEERQRGRERGGRREDGGLLQFLKLEWAGWW